MNSMENIFTINRRQKRKSRTRKPKKTLKKRKPKKPLKNISRKKMNCSPVVEDTKIFSDTCFTADVLIKIRDEYNKNHPHSNKITSSDPIIIWKTLKSRLQHCEKEDCWLKEIKDSAMRRFIDESIFAPDHPPDWDKNPNEWLSNIDILLKKTVFVKG